MSAHIFKADGRIQQWDGKQFRTIRTRKLKFDCDCGAEVCAWQEGASGQVIKGKQAVSCPLCKRFIAHVTDGRKILRVTA
jgi:hypothetical protein